MPKSNLSEIERVKLSLGNQDFLEPKIRFFCGDCATKNNLNLELPITKLIVVIF
jgi:hypothetical protein